MRALFLQQAVAMAQRVLEGVGARAMRGIDRQHQPVEKTAPVAGRTAKEAVLIRRQPEHRQMVEEASGRGHRFAVDPALALCLARRQCGRQQQRPARDHEIGEHGIAARPVAAGDHRPGRATQPSPRREQGNGFEDIGLAGAVRPTQRDERRIRRDVERRIRAEIAEPQPGDARLHLGTRHGQTRIGIST